MTGTETGAHLPRIAPHSAPGALYVRLVTDTGSVLSEHPLGEESSGQGFGDAAMTAVWIEEHPQGCVYVYVYDGDDGQCVKTLIMSGVDAGKPR